MLVLNFPLGDIELTELPEGSRSALQRVRLAGGFTNLDQLKHAVIMQMGCLDWAHPALWPTLNSARRPLFLRRTAAGMDVRAKALKQAERDFHRLLDLGIDKRSWSDVERARNNYSHAIAQANLDLRSLKAIAYAEALWATFLDSHPCEVADTAVVAS